MNQVFDPINLLLLAAAVVVFLRLRSVLGKRTGNERPPVWNPDQRSSTDTRERPEANGNVIQLPQPANRDEPPAPDRPPVWTGFAEEGSTLAQGMEKIAEADRQFGPRAFLDGARVAYEMIIGFFAKGDKAALKDLLARDVLDGFASVIDNREKAGETVDQKFVGIDKAEILGAELVNKRASVTVRFVSQLISATRDRAGKVIDGDEREIREITDVWTFERDTQSRDPNWRLAATRASA